MSVLRCRSSTSTSRVCSTAARQQCSLGEGGAIINVSSMVSEMGQLEDVANAFVYLAGDLASYVTGEVLAVDGSMTV